MKPFLAVTLSLAFTTMAAVAADPAPATASGPIKITDQEAVIIEQTIRGFVEVKHDQITLYDRKKGQTVALRLDRIVSNDPNCVKFPADGVVAICGECTEVTPEAKGNKKTTENSDKYVVWFVVNRGSLVKATVKDVFIKSVNGKPMYDWTQGADGVWSATLVPDSAPLEKPSPSPAPAPEAAPEAATESAPATAP